MEAQLLSKLYDMGILNTSAKLSDIENKLTVAAFCRRRLAVFMCMSKMSETVSAVCCSANRIVFISSHSFASLQGR
jgi:U3 small nucleolar ribonucleoprotein protein IMP3